MKRILLSLLAVVLMTSISLQSHALIKLLGLEVEVEKGTKEWNADKTDTKCVGKGLCYIKVKGNGGLLSTFGTKGTLGFTEDGRFGIAFAAANLPKEIWGDTFVGGTVTINKDIDLSGVQTLLRGCPSAIHSGTYRYVVDGEQIVLFFN